MGQPAGSRPEGPWERGDPTLRDPSRPWAPSPFGRLARAHALSVCGDAMFTTAMAGLVFFSVTRLDQARWQVAAALLFTIVPFSLAAPFIGPLLDRARGGRKWMIVALCVLRGLACLVLAWNSGNQLILYPLFTIILVLAQGYILARGALVPATVHDDTELVQANSKLAAISGIGAVAAGALAIAVMWVAGFLDPSAGAGGGPGPGPGVVLALAAVVYVAGAVEAGQLPAVRVAPAPPDEDETAELHGPWIQAASVALSAVRVVVGFTTFLLAFHFKELEQVDVWDSRVGLVLCVAVAQIGFLLGSVAAIRARRMVHEEQIIVAALVVIGLVGLLTSLMGELPGAVLLAFAVGLAANSAKQSFDAIVQRDAPDANRGRAFARFEIRFQLCWVAGALVPVIATVSPAPGAFAVGLAGVIGAAWFALARWRLRSVLPARPRVAVAASEPTLVEPRLPSRDFLGGRAATADAPADLPLDDDTEPVTTPVELTPTAEQPFSTVGAEDATIELAAVSDGFPPEADRTSAWPAPPPPAPPPWPADAPPDPWEAPTDRWDPPTSRGEPPSPGTAPLPDEELASPSDVWFPRRDRAADPPHGDGSAPDGDGAASETWGAMPRRSARRPRRRRTGWEDWPGDPDDGR
jgi:hypothetical protein